MFSKRNFTLCYGPQIVSSALYFVLWIYFGQVTKIEDYSLIAYVGIIILYLWVYLIVSKQWSQIVYQNVIILNVGWYVRQGYTTKDEILQLLIAVNIVYNLSPLYHLYRAMTLKEIDYLSKFNMIMGIFDSIFFLLFLNQTTYSKLFYIGPTIKLITILIQFLVYYDLSELKRIKLNLKKKK